MTDHTPEELERAILIAREIQIRVRASRRRWRRESATKRKERKAAQAEKRKVEQEQRKAQREAKAKLTRYVRKPSMPGRQNKAGRPPMHSHPDPAICTRCKSEPRTTGQRWCNKCHAEYMRGYDRVQDAT